MAETRYIFSLLQDSSPAKTRAFSRPSHAHGHSLRPSTNCYKLSDDPLAVFVLTGLFARRFWLGWGRTRHTAAVGKQALFMGETPRYTWTKEGVSVRRMCGRRSIPSFSYTIFVLPLRIDVCCSAATGTPLTTPICRLSSESWPPFICQ
jgi:hypothetical protein